MNRIYSEKYLQTWLALKSSRFGADMQTVHGTQFVLIECAYRQIAISLISILVCDVFFFCFFTSLEHFNILVTRGHCDTGTVRYERPKKKKNRLASLLRFKVLPFHSKYIMRHDVVAIFLLVKSRVCPIEAGQKKKTKNTANVDAPFNILFY